MFSIYRGIYFTFHEFEERKKIEKKKEKIWRKKN